MMIPRVHAPALALLVITGLGGCPNEGSEPVADTGADTPAEVADAGADTPAEVADSARSYYRLVLDTEFEEPITIERDITGKLTNFSFGSTHIAPAVSLAVSEDLTFPAVMNITFNFGIVLGSQDYPVQCDHAGEYMFGGEPPEIDITKGLRYVSSVPGSTGSLIINSWSRTPDDTFSGTFQGRIRQKTDNIEKRWADIQGEFHFILPERAAGQPN